MRVAILTCENLPKFITPETPIPDHIFEDDYLLVAGFERLGHSASIIVWTDASIDWKNFDIAVIRSTWDYIDRREEFLEAMTRIQHSSCKLFNTLDAVKWNSDKMYLFDLKKWSVPVVPTYLAANSDLENLQISFAKNDWDEVVIKPTVGGGGAGVVKINHDEIQDQYEFLSKTYPSNIYLIQPLIKSVRSEGEWSYIYADGKLCHVLLKKPVSGDYRAHGIYGGSIETAHPDKNDIMQAENILQKLPFDLLFARLDLVRVGGNLSVMEVELIEPVLYFNVAPDTVDLLVNAAERKFKS